VKIRDSVETIFLHSYALAGFEPGPSALQAHAVTTMPRRRHGVAGLFCLMHGGLGDPVLGRDPWVRIQKPVVTYDPGKSSVTSSAGLPNLF
jgi:hypothetical protein